MIRAALLTVLAGTAIAVPAGPSHAQAANDCPGVTVVVDFASLGGGDQTGCAAGDPDSGVTALRGAGFEPTRAAQQAGYFLCRIDGKPANDPCQRASPADAYWSYWHAQPGGGWTFSNTGPADRDPAPGSVEGWAFGAGDPPSSPPPAAAKKSEPSKAPAPAPTRSAPPAAAPPPAAPPPAAPRTRPSMAAQAEPSSPAAGGQQAPVPSSSAAATSAAALTPAPSATARDASVSRAEPAAQEDDGSRAGLIAAIVVLGLLGAAVARQVRLRR